MRYNSVIHHRKSIRLKGYDYSQSGAYFITVCIHQQKCLLGEIINDEMVLNRFGLIVKEEWLNSGKIRGEIELDLFVVMPNHFHGIFFVNSEAAGRPPVAPTCGGGNRSLVGRLVAGFKSVVTRRINNIRGFSNYPVWQRNYHEHIIRNEKSLEKIRDYIIHNPLTWKTDTLFSTPTKPTIYNCGVVA